MDERAKPAKSQHASEDERRDAETDYCVLQLRIIAASYAVALLVLLFLVAIELPAGGDVRGFTKPCGVVSGSRLSSPQCSTHLRPAGI